MHGGGNRTILAGTPLFRRRAVLKEEVTRDPLVQRDGYVRPRAWMQDFLDCDYIGTLADKRLKASPDI
jgi:hypothetical protein